MGGQSTILLSAMATSQSHRFSLRQQRQACSARARKLEDAISDLEERAARLLKEEKAASTQLVLLLKRYEALKVDLAEEITAVMDLASPPRSSAYSDDEDSDELESDYSESDYSDSDSDWDSDAESGLLPFEDNQSGAMSKLFQEKIAALTDLSVEMERVYARVRKVRAEMCQFLALRQACRTEMTEIVLLDSRLERAFQKLTPQS